MPPRFQHRLLPIMSGAIALACALSPAAAWAQTTKPVLPTTTAPQNPSPPAGKEASPATGNDFSNMSLEDLMNIEVIGWKPSANLRLIVTLRNLGDGTRASF